MLNFVSASRPISIELSIPGARKSDAAACPLEAARLTSLESMSMPRTKTSLEGLRRYLALLTLTVLPMIYWACGSSSQDSQYSLLDVFQKTTKDFEGGRYPDFVDEPSASGPLEIAGREIESLTPPFPSSMSFELTVPPAGSLEFSPALIMAQSVRRARVEYRISLERGAGEETFNVYRETFRANEANRWHDRRVDLSPWEGQNIVLTFATQTIPPREDALWAERIQTAWGDPILTERPWSLLANGIEQLPAESVNWFGEQFDNSGLGPDEQVMTGRFFINLLVGGLLALAIRELYKRYSSTVINRESFADMLPLFTLSTIVVISVVQYSPALALGLIGALSIVRFRTSIESPEELVYLLVCVGLGVALGGNHMLLGVTSVCVLAPFVIWLQRWGDARTPDRWTLTVTGDAGRFFSSDGPSIVDIVQRMTKVLTVDRLDYQPKEVFFRAQIVVENHDRAMELLTALRGRVRQCEISTHDMRTSRY